MLTCLTLLAAAFPQESLLLRPGAQAGQKVAYRIEVGRGGTSTETEWRGSLIPPEGAPEVVQPSRDERAEYAFTDRVKSLEAGRPGEVSRKWTEHCVSKKGAQELEKEPMPKRTLRYETVDGLCVPVLKKDQRREDLDPLHLIPGDLSFVGLLPEGRVAVGDSWVVDGLPLLAVVNTRGLAASMEMLETYRRADDDGQFTEGRDLQVSLEGLETRDGRRVARLRLSLEALLEGPWENPLERSKDSIGIGGGGSRGGPGISTRSRLFHGYRLNGTASWDVDGGQLLALDVTNSIDSEVLSCRMKRESGGAKKAPGTDPEDEMRRTVSKDEVRLKLIAEVQ